MQRLILLALMFLPGCHRISREEQARRDARDVAMVEAAQHSYPPAIPLVPQAIDAGDLGAIKAQLASFTCRFSDPGHAADRPILAAGPDRAMIRIANQPVVLASDPGSSHLPRGAWTHYAGKRYALSLDPMPTVDNPTPSGPANTPVQPMTLTIRDEHNRPVLETNGQLTCE